MISSKYKKLRGSYFRCDGNDGNKSFPCEMENRGSAQLRESGYDRYNTIYRQSNE